MRAGLKNYTKNHPVIYSEFHDVIEWWNDRVELQNAWVVDAKEIASNGYSLDLRSPNSGNSGRVTSASQVASSIETSVSSLHSFSTTTTRFAEHWQDLPKGEWDCVPFRELASQVSRPVDIDPESEYSLLGMSWYGKGLYVKAVKAGTEIKAHTLFSVQPEDFVYNRLFAWKGSFAEADEGHANCVVSNEYPCFVLDHSQVAPGFMWAYFSQPRLWEFIETISTGTTSTSRLRLKEDRLVSVPGRGVREG